MTKLRFLASIVACVLLSAGCDDELKKENVSLRTQVNTALKEKLAAQVALANKNADFEGAQQRIVDLNSRMGDDHKRIAELQMDRDQAREQLAAVSQLLKDSEVRAAALQQDLAQLKDEAARRLATQKGEVVGTASYFFNDNFGYKPDVASVAYIWAKGAFPEFNANEFTHYQLVRSTLVLKAVAGNRDIGPEITKMLESIRSESELSDAYRALSDKMTEIENSPKTIKVSADGNGSFRKRLSPGEYYVLVRSSHRNHSTALEISGSLYLQLARIEADEQTSVDAKFEAY